MRPNPERDGQGGILLGRLNSVRAVQGSCVRRESLSAPRDLGPSPSTLFGAGGSYMAVRTKCELEVRAQLPRCCGDRSGLLACRAVAPLLPAPFLPGRGVRAWTHRGFGAGALRTVWVHYSCIRLYDGAAVCVYTSTTWSERWLTGDYALDVELRQAHHTIGLSGWPCPWPVSR